MGRTQPRLLPSTLVMMINPIRELVRCIPPIRWVIQTRRMLKDVDFRSPMNQMYINSSQRTLPSSVSVAFFLDAGGRKLTIRSHTIAHGRRMSISISLPIFPLVLKEDVIVLGDGSIRKMEEVLRCTNWGTGVMSPELR